MHKLLEMTPVALAVILWICCMSACEGLQLRSHGSPIIVDKKRNTVTRRFKSGDAHEDGADSFVGSFWKGIQRFLPSTSRSRIVDTYKSPQQDSGNRYEVRLINASRVKKRHIITRLRRYLPDLSWETAEWIVEIAVEEGAALVRVLNNKNDAAYLVDMLNKADPPVTLEVYDTKKQEVVVI